MHDTTASSFSGAREVGVITNLQGNARFDNFSSVHRDHLTRALRAVTDVFCPRPQQQWASRTSGRSQVDHVPGGKRVYFHCLKQLVAFFKEVMGNGMRISEDGTALEESHRQNERSKR